VSIRSVELGQREEENTIVLKGIDAGETIVLEGQLNLFEGAEVYVHASKPAKTP
jgi:multidrug efflux pump subunit AcrA (membrane-fusion protein)